MAVTRSGDAGAPGRGVGMWKAWQCPLEGFSVREHGCLIRAYESFLGSKETLGGSLTVTMSRTRVRAKGMQG